MKVRMFREGLALGTLLALVLANARGDSPVKHGFLDRVYKDASGETAKYVLYVPPEYKGDGELPLILFLHGAGETGTDGKRQVQVGLGPVVRAREKTFPFLVVFPQAQRREQNLVQTWWPGRKEGDRALAILAEAQKEYKTDPQRV